MNAFVPIPQAIRGTEAATQDGEPFERKMARLTVQLEAQFAESAQLEQQIRRNLARWEQ